jgi:DNA polymerase I
MERKTERLFLIDGHALAYRAYFAFINRPLINSKGQNTSAIYGFLTALLRIQRSERPDHLAVVFDSKEPTFRHAEYKEYKATREKMPEDLASQIDILKELIGAFNIPVIVMPGYEADDIMGTLARLAEKEDVETFLVTGDKDFMQLVSDRIKMYKTARGSDEPEIIDAAGVRKKFGVDAAQVTDVLALMGDASDNIPGVPGIGEKTAIPLIQKFGTLDNLLEQADTVDRKGVRTKLLEHRDSALLSKKLVTIDTAVPLDISFHDLNVRQRDSEKLTTLLKELEFTSILGQLENSADADAETEPAAGGAGHPIDTASDGAGHSIETANVEYRTVATKGDFDAMMDSLRNADIVSFDTETTSRDPLSAAVVGISFSVRKGEAWYIPLEDHTIPETHLKKELQELFDRNTLKGGQNVKFDILAMRKLGLSVPPPLFDTMIAAFIIRSDGQQNLDSLAREYLDYIMVSYSDLVGTGKNQIPIREVNLDELVRYACEDADITLQLWHILKEKLTSVDALRLCEEIEFPLIGVLADMEAAGVAIDTGFLGTLSKQLSGDLLNIREDIYREAGYEFNINSTQQLGKVLFEKLALPTVKKTKTGFSTDTSVLERLKGRHPIIDRLLEYRQYTKLQSTYIDALPKLINTGTGRVHTSFNQTIASTGRLSSSNPNLQNIPIRTDLGRSIRKAFVPGSEDQVIMSSDYSQIELRVMAHISGDAGLLDAFNNGEDIHATTAAKVFDVAAGEVTPNMRRRAKEINFGIMYGISPFGLASRLELPQSEAAAIIERYFARFPGVHRYIQETTEQAQADGYVTTLMGRRRYLPDITSRNRTVQQNAIRQAINMPIQGTAADMIKIAMIRIHEEITKRNLRSRMIIQVHDELVFEVYRNELDTVRTLVEKEMAGALDLRVPIEVDTGVGANWFEAH